ncbi:hypothetical protein CAEBREN_11012 [Caenorhabditis brenneri]|uniref:Uncharacterized protein n=1 Tax=Caenorhabditis brenneri TaxID=135651 RepID=G0PGQ7_CAEBE|nr:hypothetical protein CAEBREN_11012 [Caenorhabditis brenneri]
MSMQTIEEMGKFIITIKVVYSHLNIKFQIHIQLSMILGILSIQ